MRLLPQRASPYKQFFECHSFACGYCTSMSAQTARIAVRLLPQRASPCKQFFECHSFAVAIIPQNEGDSFNQKAFHEAILKSGAAPFHVVQRNVDAYISEASGGVPAAA